MHDVSHIIDGAIATMIRHLSAALVVALLIGGKTLWKLVRRIDTKPAVVGPADAERWVEEKCCSLCHPDATPSRLVRPAVDRPS